MFIPQYFDIYDGTEWLFIYHGIYMVLHGKCPKQQQQHTEGLNSYVPWYLIYLKEQNVIAMVKCPKSMVIPWCIDIYSTMLLNNCHICILWYLQGTQKFFKE